MVSDQRPPTFRLYEVPLTQAERKLSLAALTELRDQEIERLMGMRSYPEDEVAMIRTAFAEWAGVRVVAMASTEEAELASHIMAITTYVEMVQMESGSHDAEMS